MRKKTALRPPPSKNRAPIIILIAVFIVFALIAAGN